MRAVQVYTMEKGGMKAQRVKNWAQDEYMKLTPATRTLIRGAVVVTKMAAQTAAGI